MEDLNTTGRMHKIIMTEIKIFILVGQIEYILNTVVMNVNLKILI